ncbi:MAG: dihydropteroate synthase [Solirubrobacterales bacterium]|nr:dihydropteroate synthase [Solirubrobacterales bacterium]
MIEAGPTLRTAGDTVDLSEPVIVGVVNATPDSFSDRGDRSTTGSIRQVSRHLEDGASIIEIGGESNVTNRPAVSASTEIDRILPVVEAAVEAGATVSIDTYKPEVAAAALDAGAAMVNDISGSDSSGMIELCADRGAAVVVMHTEVAPKSQIWDERLYPDGVTARQVSFFEARLAALAAAGVERDCVVIDPGPDFAKTPRQTVDSLAGLPRLAALGCPVMLAVSRKDFVGAITGRRPGDRSGGTFGAIAAGLELGARLLRVHDVAGTSDFLRVWQAVNDPEAVSPQLRISEEIRREPPAGSGPGETGAGRSGPSDRGSAIG